MSDDASYQGYEEWKGWSDAEFMRLPAGERAYLDLEMRGIPVSGEHVLEIGFGSGGFLAWAQAQGATVCGTEISERNVALAVARGVTILPVDLSVSASNYAGTFGVVAAFDVLEHLSYAETATLLRHVDGLLRPGGHFVARFPNGQSPLGGIYQNADYTHISTLSGSIIAQLARGTSLEQVRAENSAVPGGGLAKRAQHLARRGYEALLCRLYGFRAPLGPNLTIVMRRGKGTA